MKEEMDTSKQEPDENECDVNGVPQIITPDSMDRKSAMAYFGLGESANSFELDQKFFQQTKKYRGDLKTNHDKLEEINQVYFIASGKKSEEKQKEISRAKEKKLFGKSFADWKVHFYYGWWKYVLVALLAVMAFFLIRQVFFVPRTDFRVISLGHFEKTEDHLTNYLIDRLGYVNPEVSNMDIIVDKSENDSAETMYSSLGATALIAVASDVMITDISTMPYFLDYIAPMDDFYASLQSTLSEEQLSVIVPVYYSFAQYYDLPFDGEDTDEPPVLTEKDYERHVYGLMILDPEAINSLGYVNNWRSRIPSIVFSVSTSAKNEEASEAFIRSILTDGSIISVD